MASPGVLGVLFCGGRGTRLGEITRFVSKSLLPIYDRPVFRFGLDLLENARGVDSILLLTNETNDEALSQLGYPTLI
jgi:dTDP-glucose pyrophosphorylase